MGRVVEAGAHAVKVEGRIVRLARIVGERYQFLKEPDQVVRELLASPADIDIFTFVPSIVDAGRVLHYAREEENFAALKVSTYDHWWNEQISRKTRNMVRLAAKKGVSCRRVVFDDDLVRRIQLVYDETTTRQGKPNVHHGKDLETHRIAHATFLDRSVFIGAFLSDEMIGFAKLTWDEERTQAGLMNIVGMVCHRDKATSNALIAESVKFCAESAIPNLVYARYTYGRKAADSLVEFKKHNGFQQVDVPRYYVPLTRRGRIALAWGLHRDASTFVPEGVMSRLRQIRKWWYQSRLTKSEGL